MHDEHVGLGCGETRLVHAVEACVLAQAREGHPLGALHLDAEHVGDVERGQHLIERGEGLGPEDVGARRQERGRRNDDRRRSHRAKRGYERASDSRVRDIADDAYGETLEPTGPAAHREQVEERLCGVLVHAIAAVDDVRVHALGEHMRRARVGVAHHDEVARHRRERRRCVAEALPLHRSRCRACHVDRIGRETLRCDLEARPRARGGLEEQVDDGTAPKGGQLLDAALVDLGERLSGVEDERDIVGGKIVHRDDVAARERGHSATSSSMTTESSASSTSESVTRTRSLRDVGTFLPT